MAKTLNVRTTLYDVTANVVIKSDDGISVVKFDGEGSATKNVRALEKDIRNIYENDGFAVLAIDDIKTYKVVSVKSYKVNASIREIVDACIATGLDVSEVINADADNADSAESEEA